MTYSERICRRTSPFSLGEQSPAALRPQPESRVLSHARTENCCQQSAQHRCSVGRFEAGGRSKIQNVGLAGPSQGSPVQLHADFEVLCLSVSPSAPLAHPVRPVLRRSPRHGREAEEAKRLETHAAVNIQRSWRGFFVRDGLAKCVWAAHFVQVRPILLRPRQAPSSSLPATLKLHRPHPHPTRSAAGAATRAASAPTSSASSWPPSSAGASSTTARRRSSAAGAASAAASTSTASTPARPTSSGCSARPRRSGGSSRGPSSSRRSSSPRRRSRRRSASSRRAGPSADLPSSPHPLLPQAPPPHAAYQPRCVASHRDICSIHPAELAPREAPPPLHNQLRRRLPRALLAVPLRGRRRGAEAPLRGAARVGAGARCPRGRRRGGRRAAAARAPRPAAALPREHPGHGAVQRRPRAAAGRACSAQAAGALFQPPRNPTLSSLSEAAAAPICVSHAPVSHRSSWAGRTFTLRPSRWTLRRRPPPSPPPSPSRHAFWGRPPLAPVLCICRSGQSSRRRRGESATRPPPAAAYPRSDAGPVHSGPLGKHQAAVQDGVPGQQGV